MFVADDLGAWLVAVLADAGRKRLTTLARGTDQERALREAAKSAIEATAQELRPDSADEAEQVAAVVNHVFNEPYGTPLLPERATLLQGLQATITGRLAVLGDSDLTGIGKSSADVLGVDTGVLAEKLIANLIQQITNKGARGGPLFPLASLLAQDKAQVHLGQFDSKLNEILARLDGGRRPESVRPGRVFVQYTLTLDGELEFDAQAWVDALSNERKQMVEEAVGERLDADFDLYGGGGIAACVDGGELEFDVTTEAERNAQWDEEAIETASRAYAGIGDYDEWPKDLPRPSGTDSYVTVHNGVTYVVLRRQDGIVAIYDVADGAFNSLTAWPREIETR